MFIMKVNVQNFRKPHVMTTVYWYTSSDSTLTFTFRLSITLKLNALTLWVGNIGARQNLVSTPNFTNAKKKPSFNLVFICHIHDAGLKKKSSGKTEINVMLVALKNKDVCYMPRRSVWWLNLVPKRWSYVVSWQTALSIWKTKNEIV